MYSVKSEAAVLQSAAAHACSSSDRVKQHQLESAQLTAEGLCVVCVCCDTKWQLVCIGFVCLITEASAESFAIRTCSAIEHNLIPFC
jgi:hypothetical protein